MNTNNNTNNNINLKSNLEEVKEGILSIKKTNFFNRKKAINNIKASLAKFSNMGKITVKSEQISQLLDDYSKEHQIENYYELCSNYYSLEMLVKRYLKEGKSSIGESQTNQNYFNKLWAAC